MSKSKESKTKNAGSKYAVVFNAEVQARFWQQVEKRKPNECWPWKGRKTGDSGAFFVDGVELRVGKVAYLIAHPDADPDGRYTSSVCHNAACCNEVHVLPAGQKKASEPAQVAAQSEDKSEGAVKADRGKKGKAAKKAPSAKASVAQPKQAATKRVSRKS